jgi:hypothetical protein
MNSATFQTYRHSGKFGIQGPLLAVAFAVIASIPLGYAYSYLTKWIPFIYANFLATMGYGALFGFVCGRLMRFARVRNNAVAALTGFIAGIIALYFAWNGHIHASFIGAPWLCSPGELMGGIKQLYNDGSWALQGGAPLTGVPLAVIWGIEGSVIVGFSTVLCLRMVSEIPYCEASQCWLDKVKKIDTLAPFEDSAQLASFKAGDLGPLTQARPRGELAAIWTRIVLRHSPRCQVFHTICLQQISIYRDKNGKPKQKSKSLTRDLILPAEMFGLITQFENFGKPAPPPAEVQP